VFIHSSQSGARIVNGTGIIDYFGMYNETPHTEIKLIKQVFKNNGATSIKIYTNSENVKIKVILNPRYMSGKRVYGLSSKREL
jgi:hypothetical protein